MNAITPESQITGLNNWLERRGATFAVFIGTATLALFSSACGLPFPACRVSIPHISSLSPDHVYAGGPDVPVKVIGTGFDRGPHIFIANQRVSSLSPTYIDPQEIDIIIPKDQTATPGGIPLIITNSCGTNEDGDFAKSNSFVFTVLGFTITAVSGTPQQTHIGSLFAQSLAATVKGTDGNPAAAVAVTFTAPSTGASGTFAAPAPANVVTVQTDRNGLATTPTFTANAIAGAYSINATVDGAAAPAVFFLTNLSNLTILTSSFPDGTANGSYSQPLQTMGGVGTLTWSVSGGTLPAGLSLADTTPNSGPGMISGIPTSAGTSSFTVRVQDSSTPPQVDTKDFSITIHPSIPTTMQLVSESSDGTQANRASFFPATSSNGRFVAFESVATNLSPTGSPIPAIFLRDLCIGADASCTKATTLVSLDQDNNPISSVEPSISGDGRYITFTASITSTSTGSTNIVLLRDTCNSNGQTVPDCTPATTLVSQNPNGSTPDSDSLGGRINEDGRYVVFQSYASGLVSGLINNTIAVYVFDTCHGTAPGTCVPATSLVSLATDGSVANDRSTVPTINSDGRFIAFLSWATNLVPGDTNGVDDVFVRDTCAGVISCTPSTSRISLAVDGTQQNGQTSGLVPAISRGGRFIAFGSMATNLTPTITFPFPGGMQIYVRDTCLGAAVLCNPNTILISGTPDGIAGNNNSGGVSMSRDGRFIAFASASANLIIGENNNIHQQIFLQDTCVGTTGACSQSTGILSFSAGQLGNGDSGEPVITPDGAFVLFASAASNLVPHDANSNDDVFLAPTGFPPSTAATVALRAHLP